MDKVAAMQDSFDAPISDPDNDLLGMYKYASTLATFLKGDEPPYIKPPFTVGIYGQWGEGKTSFVHLLHHFLDPTARTNQPTYKFIKFESWPYSDSDMLWRALILTIAKELYSVQPQPPAPDASDSTPRGLLARLAALLRSDGITLRPEPAQIDKYAGYHELEQRLNRGGYGKVGRDGSQQGQLEETRMLAVIGGALNAIGSISPLVAAVRGFFNLDTNLNLMEAVNQEKNEAIRETIESIEEFRDAFNELIRDKGGNKPVFVFIDDLDRCRPEVVLDVLEAIKIFLGEANCIFIVAADEQLIGQGLRLRYKDLLELDEKQTQQGDVPQILQTQQNYFAQKGQEYFEKIIQLGVRVPPRDTKHTHSFVSAQFPGWVPATDITRIALSTNPRRLKQHCNYLAYLRLVYDMRVPNQQNKHLIGIFHKLVAFRARNVKHFSAFCAIADDPAQYLGIVKAMEQLLAASEDDVLLPEARQLLTRPEHHELYAHIVHIAPLLRLFKMKPPFAAADPADIKILALFADVEPDGDGSLQTEDGPFKRVLDAVIKPTFESQPNQDLLQELIKSGLARLIYINLLAPKVRQALVQLAHNPAWRVQIRLVDEQIDTLGRGGKPVITGLHPAARQLIESIEQSHREKDGQSSELFEMLLNIPRLSMLLPEEIKQYERIRVRLPHPETLLNPRFADTSTENKALSVAEAAYQSLTKNTQVCDEIEKLLNIRLKIAQHCWEVRKFGKLYALDQRWPQLADQLRDNPAVFYSLESRFLQPPALDPDPDPTDDLERLWQYWQQDKKLGQFLRLLPHFSQFVDQTPDLQEFFAISPNLVKSPTLTDFLPETTPGQVDGSRPPATVTQNSAPTYVDINVMIEAIEAPPVTDQQPTTPETRSTHYKLTIDMMDQMVGFSRSETISIDWAALSEDIRAHLPFPRNRSGGRSASAPRGRVSGEDAAILNADPAFGHKVTEALSYIGRRLYTTLFQNELRAREFDKLLSANHRSRIILKFPQNDSQLASLPWECLTTSSARRFLGLVERYSILRHYPAAFQARRAQFSLPLKLLAVFPEPKDAPPIHAEAHGHLLESRLTEAVRAGQVELRIVQPATFEELNIELALFKPDIFHFYGHGIFDQARQEGALLFVDKQGKADAVFASSLQNCFADSTVQFAMLQACDSAATAAADVITGVAGALLHAGVTATVATTSVVLVDAAMCFTRDFYRTFLAGKSIEEAVVQGRNSIQATGLDWSPYALFTNSIDLDGLRLML